MPANKLTKKKTETDLEAAIRGTVMRVFPWLDPAHVRHQVKFSFTFGRSRIDVDNTDSYDKQARSDIVLEKGGVPLAVLELKREGNALSAEDEAQGLSYARVLDPMAPIVIVTNGDETRIFDSYTGQCLEADTLTKTQFVATVNAAARLAAGNLKQAIQTLMGNEPTIWRQAVEQLSDATIEDLTATSDNPGLPFTKDFLIQREATEEAIDLLEEGKRLILIEGPPLIGKSNILRDLAGRTRKADRFATLLIEVGRSGIVQAVADRLANQLNWPVTKEEARAWLMQLSRGDQNPHLVLALDGIDPRDKKAVAEIEDLSSSRFGVGLRVVVTFDDSAVHRILESKGGRDQSQIGRRATRIAVDRMSDAEFRAAVDMLSDMRIWLMRGAQSARELRFPWALRMRVWSVMQNAKFGDPNWGVSLAPLMGLEIIAHAREAFLGQELRHQFHEIARAVLDDARSRKRPIALVLQSMGVFMVRKKKLTKRLTDATIKRLVKDGYLKPAMQPSGEPVLIVRLPELLASELAALIAHELTQSELSDPSTAARWLTGASSNLPLGDIVTAQAILDAASSGFGLSLDLVLALAETRPTLQTVQPGARFATYQPGIGLVDFTVTEDGSLLVEANGRHGRIELDPEETPGEIYHDFHSWMILSHLAMVPSVARIDGVDERIDTAILLEVASAPVVLRSVGPEVEFNAVRVHDVPGEGSIVCHLEGIVEPITFALFEFFYREFRVAADWINEACRRNSLALVARVQIALQYLADIEDGDRSDFAREMLDGPVKASFKALPELHPERG
ncbi:type I restriction endonuclease [Brucella sp. BE17]|uniref:type I restriction endonuclease n=1 Tax=Brucella sp. BE17 TaxID=3142977 RepID=UPI0031BBB506